MKCMSVNSSHTDMKDAYRNSPMYRAINGYYDLDEHIKPNADELRDGRMELALHLFSHGHNNESDKAELLCGACGFGKLPVVTNLIEQHQLDPNGEC